MARGWGLGQGAFSRVPLFGSVLGPQSRSGGIAHRCLDGSKLGCLGWVHTERCPRRQPKERGGEREREKEKRERNKDR